MIEFDEFGKKLVTIEEAIMIAFLSPGWRLPTLQEYQKYRHDELKYCWDESDIDNKGIEPCITARIRLVRTI